MINRFMVLLSVAFLAVFVPSAQALVPDTCDVQYEAIVKLRAPYAGSYNVWDTVYGEAQTDERFKSAIVLESGSVFVAGERGFPDKEDKKSVLLAEIGRNGRVLKEYEHELPGLVEVVKIHPHASGAIVVANVKPKGERAHIWVGVFNLQGQLLYQKHIKGGRAALKAYDIEFAPGGKTYILSAFSEVEGSGVAGSTVLYRISGKGSVISHHSFVIGSENAMVDIRVLDNGEIMGAGYIMDADGRKTGWLIRLQDDFRMIWQKPYPRGAAAELVAVEPLVKGFMAAVGTALPVSEGNRAGWLLAVDENSGDVGWQRYFTEGLHFDGRDIMVSKDAMISVLLDGTAPEGSDEPEHVRLMSVNPRGELFSSDEYFNGAGVDAYQLLQSAGVEQLVIGATRIDHKIEAMQGPQLPGETAIKTVRSSEGWVIATPGIDPYDDPCKAKKRTLP